MVCGPQDNSEGFYGLVLCGLELWCQRCAFKGQGKKLPCYFKGVSS